MKQIRYIPVKPVSNFVQYRLSMYNYYNENVRAKVEDYERQIKKYKQKNCYNNLYYNNVFKEPPFNEPDMEYKSYEEFLEKHTKRYRFISKIKNYLLSHYENRLDNFYKSVYHPSVVARMLDEGYEIEAAFTKLDEHTNYVSP